MKRYKIYNYLLFNEIKYIYYRIIIDDDILKLFIYKDGKLVEEHYNNYSIKKNILKFNGNIFSCDKILYKNIKINIVNYRDCLFKYDGVLNGLNNNGKIYIENESYFNKPINYIKFICTDINKKCFYSITNIKWMSKEKNSIYCNINDNLIKDKYFIKSAIDSNLLRIKTYQFNYLLSYDIIKGNKNNNCTYSFVDSKANLSINKMFDKPLIKQYDSNTLIISNIF